MEGPEYSKAYGEPLPPADPNRFERIVAPLQSWNRELGFIVNAYLLGGPELMNSPDRRPADELERLDIPPDDPALPIPDETVENYFTRYTEWMNHHTGPMRHRLSIELRTALQEVETSGLSIDQKREAVQAVLADSGRAESITMFHTLNSCMRVHWLRLVTGKWPKIGRGQDDRIWWTNRAQQDIAGVGMRISETRLEYMRRLGLERYFSRDWLAVRSRREGRGNELDVGIWGLEIAKRAMAEGSDDIIVISAPQRFESTDRAVPRLLAEELGRPFKNPNSDYLEINLANRQVIGLQAKSSSIGGKAKRYDAERVAVLTGTEIGNYITVEFAEDEGALSEGSKLSRVFSFSGTLCLSMALDLPRHGPDTAVVFQDASPDWPPMPGRAPETYRAYNRQLAKQLAAAGYFPPPDGSWRAHLRNAAQQAGPAILRNIGVELGPDSFFLRGVD